MSFFSSPKKTLSRRQTPPRMFLPGFVVVAQHHWLDGQRVRKGTSSFELQQGVVSASGAFWKHNLSVLVFVFVVVNAVCVCGGRGGFVFVFAIKVHTMTTTTTKANTATTANQPPRQTFKAKYPFDTEEKKKEENSQSSVTMKNEQGSSDFKTTHRRKRASHKEFTITDHRGGIGVADMCNNLLFRAQGRSGRR